jgi:hypothetical protein
MNYQNERMMRVNGWIWVMAFASLSACTDPKMEQVNALRTETIALHDEVMPRMGEVVSLAGDLKKLREEMTVDTADSAAMVAASSQRTEFTDQIAALDQAHEAMMEWMADFEPAYEQDQPVDSAIAYYTRQRDLIAGVKQLIEQEIEDASAMKDHGAH